jgi:hypothetical protein
MGSFTAASVAAASPQKFRKDMFITVAPRKTGEQRCLQPLIREEFLDAPIPALLKPFELRP